jgi:DNA-directed RNA polymerase specialized sigma24 family protein
MEKIVEDDFDLRCQLDLLGSHEEQQRAVRTLFEHYKGPMMAMIKRKLPTLLPDEAASAVHEAFCEIYQKAQANDLDVDRPLKGLLFTIAIRKAIDLRRKPSSCVCTDDEFTEKVAQRLDGTNVHGTWKRLRQNEQVDEIKQEFRAFVSTLPPRQKLVASVLAEALPDTLTDKEIVDAIYSRYGQRLTAMEVKGAKQQLVSKFRTLMQQKEKR